MRMTPATLVPALCAALSMAAAGGPPPEYRFEADARDTSVADVALRSGDSADLVWRLRGADGAPWEAMAAEAVYQTNGMPDNLWWPAPASCASNEVRVSWTPALDPGADSVFMLVRVRGCAWRCATRIRIARGPGERPGGLPLPVPSIDFAAVAVTNAPWALPGEVEAAIAAATNATQESSPYADPAPWSIAAALLPVQDGAAAETNAVGDVGAVVLVAATWQDAQFSIETEDRPPPYDYAAPTGTWSIADDPAGAASSISAAGLLSASRLAAGNVTVQYAAGAAGTQGRAVFLQQTRAETPLPGFVELPGSLRNAWSTNLLARLAAIDYSAASEYAHCYGGMAYGPEYIADALSPFNDLGDSLAAPMGPNAGFFWPALATNLLPRSVARLDIADGRPWAASPVLFISPHWAVQAAHWNFAPAAILCTNYEAGAFVTLPAARRVPMPGGSDLALVRYRSPAPPQCVARLIRRADLEALSPSLFDRACGIHFSQHGTVHPFAIGGASAGGPDWAATGYPAATNACHLTHGGDSGQPIALVTPRAQVVWLACHHTVNGGPWLYDDANLAWIEAQLAADGEAPTYWTVEELR